MSLRISDGVAGGYIPQFWLGNRSWPRGGGGGGGSGGGVLFYAVVSCGVSG